MPPLAPIQTIDDGATTAIDLLRNGLGAQCRTPFIIGLPVWITKPDSQISAWRAIRADAVQTQSMRLCAVAPATPYGGHQYFGRVEMSLGALVNLPIKACDWLSVSV